MKAKLWIAGYIFILALMLGGIGKTVYDVDPFFHYHKPNTDQYFYTLDNQRSQNNGICKNFDYDALISGTSMTENFSTTEMDQIFGTNSIKVSYSGASYKEINDSIELALAYNPSLKTVVRGLDMKKFFDASDFMVTNLGKFPTYLYDENPFNDVQYLFNRDILFERTYEMIKATDTWGFEPGITSFDDYSNWQKDWVFGINAVAKEGVNTVITGEEKHLTDEEKSGIYDNIYQNVGSIAEKNKDVTFYYFFTPYSALWWEEQLETGNIYRQIEAEQYVIEILLQYENIKLFSFNMRTDITTNINNYRDTTHYGEWVNSLILKWMHSGNYQLTADNYIPYLEDELQFYCSFDYESLNEQEDYEDDYYAATLVNQ